MNLLRTSWRATLGVAAAFWGVWLALAALESRVGPNLLVSTLFFLSIPGLVAYLFVANREVLGRLPRSPVALVAAGLTMLTAAAAIVLIGLLAAHRLESLLAPA